LQQQIRQREYDIDRVKEKMPQHSSISQSTASPLKPIDPSVKKSMNWAVNHEIEELRNQVSELTKRLDILYDKMDSVVMKHSNVL